MEFFFYWDNYSGNKFIDRGSELNKKKGAIKMHDDVLGNNINLEYNKLKDEISEDSMMLGVECPLGINVQDISDVCGECEDCGICIGAESSLGMPEMPEEPLIELSLWG